MSQEKTLSKNARSLVLAGAGFAVAWGAAPVSAQTALTYTDGQAQTGQGIYRQV